MTEIEKNKNRLLQLLKENALKFGKIKLASGKTSNYYIDAKQVTLDPEGAYLTAKIFLDMLKDEKFDAIGGLTIGADPIIGAIAAVSYRNNMPLQTFIVRKEPKKHGMQKYIEGRQLKPNCRPRIKVFRIEKFGNPWASRGKNNFCVQTKTVG